MTFGGKARVFELIFSSKLHIDSMRIHNKLFETGQICLHVQQVQNVKVDKGDLNTKIFNDIIDDPSIDSNNQGFENFSRITIDVSSFEILRLHHLGHKRLLCDLSKNNTSFQWIAS